MAFKNKLQKGLAGLVIGASLLIPAGKVNAEWIKLESVFSGLPAAKAPDVLLYHDSGIGATDGYDAGIDGIYSFKTTPAIDFFSQISGYKLSDDDRDISSISTFNTLMQGNGLTGTESGTLEFIMSGLTDFQNQNVWADIYKGTTPVLTGIDVKAYDTANTKIPLSLSNGESYSINVGFSSIPEPSSFVLFAGLGIAGASAYTLSRLNKKKE